MAQFVIRLYPSDIVAADPIPNTKHSLVFHYTSIDTLDKILQNKTLRLTNLRDTNDISEYNYGLNLLKREVLEFEERIGVEANYRITNNFFNTKFFSDVLYFISFTNNCDNLQYWNSRYVPNDAPISIGFDVPTLENTGLKVNPCIYINKLPKLTPDLYNILWNMCFRPTRIKNNDKSRFISLTFELAHMKDVNFIHEKELRIVAPLVNNNVVHFTRWNKPCRGFYFPFDLNAIKTITIGPCAQIQQNYNIIIKLAREYGLNCDITLSKIPFRM